MMEKQVSLPDLLDDAILEAVSTIDYCLSFRKEGKIWDNATFRGGCLGFPATVLMFSIADTIGSYFQDLDPRFSVVVDGKNEYISKRHRRGETFSHFLIFNSEYYEQNFTMDEIYQLYKRYRCLLTHNFSLAINNWIVRGDNKKEKFFSIEENERGDKGYLLQLAPFFKKTQQAVNKFRSNIDEIVRIRSESETFEIPEYNADFSPLGLRNDEIDFFGKSNDRLPSDPSGIGHDETKPLKDDLDFTSPSGTNFTG